MKKLYTLELSGSNLIALPNSFNNFKQLTKLSVRNTQINILPDSISKLENLEELDFSGNRNLEGDLPDCIYRLRKLEVLDFSNTSLSRINNNIAKLSKLIRIYFDDTNIYDLPDSITELQELTWLRLSSCKFQIIPESLAKLDLDFYRVSGRKRFIDISNNPFNSVFKKMIHEAKRNSTKLKSAVLKYYSDRREKEQKLYELKLILVGHGLVGKTVLANVLLNKETSNGKEEHPERTVVDIHSWILKKEILNRGSVYRFEDDLKINLWDFGGQEKYVYNHQLFFTPNTIYLLVTDTVSQDRFDDVNYWLPMINSLAPNSPILLVVNKSDVDTKNIPIKALQEKYKQINSSIHVSALKGTNIEELKQRIISIVQKDSTLFERMQKILPKHWQKVKSKLLSKKEKTMDKKEFDSICIDSGITDSESILSLLNYFHESGIVYHIDDGLGSVILLDLNWITEKINLVFSSEMINKNKGKISREEIFEILGKDKSITIDFISLVEHPNFDLFYKIQNTHNYVTPHLLPNEKLREAYLPDTKFICRYNFDFALTRIIHKFIVQMHSKIYKDIVWRFGLLIKENNTFVLIEQEQESGTIYVRMSSHDENFYNSINQKFRDIIKEILKSDSKNFFYHEIACNCDECSKKFNLVEDKPYYFNQRLIEKLKKDGKSSLQCQSSGIVIDLNKLMNGVQSMEDKNKGGVNVNVSGNLIMNDSASIGSKITGISSIDLESLIKTILNLKTDKNLSDDERIQKISEANDKIVVPDKKFYEGQVKVGSLILVNFTLSAMIILSPEHFYWRL
ncbi:MAG: GTP-binding protein [Leptospiraceae bacterium]|nr:GTP-binding protein [Leptospiraceae bacterium]